MRRAAVLAIGVAILAASSAGAASRSPESRAVRLRSFGTCAQFLAYARSHAKGLVGPNGLRGYPGPLTAVPPEAAAPVQADGGVPGVDFSTTNVQEAGVDEPDIVKTDGSAIFSLAQGRIWAIDVSGSKPRLSGSLQLDQGWNAQLLLYGKHLLVLSGGGGPPIVPRGAGSILPIRGAGTVLTEIDVSDPSSMRVVRTMSVDGGYLSARLVGSTARVVITSTPYLPLVYQGQKGAETPAAAERKNRGLIASSRLRNWLPYYTLRDRKAKRTIHRALVGCRQVRRPADFSGLGMITVLTIDLARGLEPVDSDAVMADGNTVYASTDNLYVASQRWGWANPESGEAPQGVTTAIHAFDISSPDETVYRASGEVSGYILNQWALSENGGYLRVASTEAPAWLAQNEGQQSESFVTVLRRDGGSLVQAGRVGGLGKGERIYAVRFIGDVGYVVTFRQVDPLYTLDLSDPANPKVVGELKIQGYSAYLHPVGNGLLLGVGQDATDEGRVLGTQLSLFDVSNPARPLRLQQEAIDRGWSEAEWDHHAFLWWPASELAVLPVQASFLDGTSFVGALGYRVDRSGIEKIGAVTHPVQTPFVEGEPAAQQYSAQIRRSVVVGNTLYTISDAGIKASGLAALGNLAWVAFR